MRVVAAALLCSICACASSTPRPLPDDAIPRAWETSTGTTGAWWSSFGDPILSELIATAESRNLDVRIADARIQEARASLSGAAAELWPELSASIGATAGHAPTDSFKMGLGVSWEADVFGRLRDAEKAAVSDAAASEADRRAVELTLVSDVAETYVEYRLRRVQYLLSVKTSEAEARTVRITQARFEQGTASRFDLERALAVLALARSRIPEAEELALAARHRLALLLAEPPESVVRTLGPDDRPMPDSDPLRVLETPADVVARRPDVRAAEWRMLASLSRRDAATKLRYPRFDVAAMIGLQSDDIRNLFDPVSAVWSLGLGVVSPLIDFGRIRAQIEIADARQEQAYLEYERSVRTALEEAQTAIISYAHGVVKQKELENALTSADKAAEFARLQYTQGTVSLLDVLEAERSLNEAQLSWSQATADVSLRVIRIHRTLGG